MEPDNVSAHEEDFENQDRYLNNSKKNKNKKRKDINKQEAFLEFKACEEGNQLEVSILDNRMELKEIKIKAKDLTEKCNLSKKNIDSVKSDLDKKQDERKAQNQLGLDDADIDNEENQEEIIDEEELAMLTHLKDLKKAYRSSF